MKNFLLFLIWVYQKTIGVFLGGQCRFYPSCSEYFKGSLEKYHLPQGIYFGILRILRCHPWNLGGVDRP